MARPQLDINFFDRAVIADPWAIYPEIRATGRVVWNGTMQGWMVPNYDECLEILSDRRGRFGMLAAGDGVMPWFEEQNMITSNGQEHQRLRLCMTNLFSARAMAPWETRVAEVVDELLEPLVTVGSSFDLIADFTLIPTIIVAEMLGVPPERYDDFRRWSHAIVDSNSWGHEGAAAKAVVVQAGAELNDYMRSEIERHQRERPDDLLTAMLGFVETGQMSLAEVQSTAVLILAAGYDTTAKVLSNALVGFSEFPDQRQLVIDNLALVPDAIEEILRWSGTSHCTVRIALQDAVLGGVEISRGDLLYVMLGAAGRDPARWENPDQLDIRRERQAHFGFGYGPHLCLGAPLARLETKVALERLLTVAPDFELTDVEWALSYFAHGPDRGRINIPVRV